MKMPNKTAHLKKIIRFSVKRKRDVFSKKEISRNSKSIQTRLFSLQEYKKSKNIMFYISFGSEVITHDMIKNTIKDGKRVYVPITDIKKKKLVISELENFDKELEISTYNILEPKKKYLRIADKKILDMVIVPGVAFDLKGHRIGYGGGYYDRFLNDFKKIKIGLSFESQIVKNVPAEETDIMVDMVITEKRTVKM